MTVAAEQDATAAASLTPTSTVTVFEVDAAIDASVDAQEQQPQRKRTADEQQLMEQSEGDGFLLSLLPRDRRLRSPSLQRPNHYYEPLGVAFGFSQAEKGNSAAGGVSACLSGDPKVDPASILFNRHFNKGTAFTREERKILGLEGLLPAQIEDIDLQVSRCYYQVCAFKLPISKYIYLHSLMERNETLFYRLLISYLSELMPFIYTPTVGQACLEYGLHFRQAEGMYLSQNEKGRIAEVLRNWRPNARDETSIIVVTDGSRILGLGDLGASGMGIPIGKLALYVAAGGFHPATILPVVLDVGCDNQQLLQDKFYLGQKHKRLPDSDFYSLFDEFMTAVKQRWPEALVQFEDFSNNHCFDVLKRYRNDYLCFNDDIQGTGCVIAAGFLNALRITKTDPADARILFLGAGAAGIGVANQIAQALQTKHSMTVDQTRSLFYMVDSKGLLSTYRVECNRETVAEFKLPYLRTSVDRLLTDLNDIVEFVKPTALIGLSGQRGAFSLEILKRMGELNDRPIILPLSNPTDKAECTFRDALEQTNGRVVFASGSPFEAEERDGVIFTPSQGNNLYAFPGLGFGAFLCGAARVTDEMVTAVTVALAECTTEEQLRKGWLYPPLSDIRQVSCRVAATTILFAVKQKLASNIMCDLQSAAAAASVSATASAETAAAGASPDLVEEMIQYVKKNQYYPSYLEWRVKTVVAADENVAYDDK